MSDAAVGRCPGLPHTGRKCFSRSHRLAPPSLTLFLTFSKRKNCRYSYTSPRRQVHAPTLRWLHPSDQACVLLPLVTMPPLTCVIQNKCKSCPRRRRYNPHLSIHAKGFVMVTLRATFHAVKGRCTPRYPSAPLGVEPKTDTDHDCCRHSTIAPTPSGITRSALTAPPPPHHPLASKRWYRNQRSGNNSGGHANGRTRPQQNRWPLVTTTPSV